MQRQVLAAKSTCCEETTLWDRRTALRLGWFRLLFYRPAGPRPRAKNIVTYGGLYFHYARGDDGRGVADNGTG